MSRNTTARNLDFLIHHTLRASALRFPDKEALVHGDERLTYREVSARVAGLASGLRAAGLQRGERVAIYLDPGIAQAISIFGASQAAGVFVPANGALFANQVAHIARDCGISALITSAAKLDSLQPVLDEIPSLRFLVVVCKDEACSIRRTTYDFTAMTNTAVEESWTDWGIEKDLAAILYTSGSTGKPKGVMLSHANLMAGAVLSPVTLISRPTTASLPFFPSALMLDSISSPRLFNKAARWFSSISYSPSKSWKLW
jgi:acyl-CoA synthetase (AMP-forming)/AMP-acid ligase II